MVDSCLAVFLIFFVAFLFILLCVDICLMARWVLRPLDEAAKGWRRPTQFTIADFLCLAVLLQIITALVFGLFGTPTKETAWIMWLVGIFAWLACTAFWAKCAQVMSRAGIQKPWHRAALLLFVWPATIIGAPAAPVFMVAAVVSVVIEEFLVAGLCVLGVIVAAGALFLSARLTRQMVAAAEPGLAEVVAVGATAGSSGDESGATADLPSSVDPADPPGTAGQASSGALPPAETPPPSPSESS
ncbi:MAG: hypothetical protein JW809_19860 [Pirellulales bacterium]|nr:hypothetical protein [Pirellulales bacterium]